MKKIKIIIPIMLAIIVLFGSTVFASTNATGKPSMTINGSVVTCKATVLYSGQYIDATLELYQGSTLVNSWHKTGTGYVSFNETESFISGLSYTLTLSGTVDGVAFTPESVTRTLW